MIFIGLAISLGGGLVAYLIAGIVIYNQLSKVEPGCKALADEVESYQPDSFYKEGFELSAYYMTDFQEVSFSPRGDGDLTLRGWYIPAPARESSDPTVIVVHGVTSCKRDQYVLLTAGMLHRAGFNVLVFDLRNHGDSDQDDSRHAAGSKEYRDVLGAWDWVRQSKETPPQSIGLVGFSMGAATVTIAQAQEPGVQAVWEDSGFGNIKEVISDELKREGYPAFLGWSAPFISQVLTGESITAKNALESLDKLDGRAYYIVHGDMDERVKVDYAYDLLKRLKDNSDQPAGFWITPGSLHVNSIFDHQEEYEGRLTSYFRRSLSL